MAMSYYIVTPEYDVVIPVTDEGQGPVEMVADVVEIEAETARDAKALGVKLMLADRTRKNRWCKNQRRDGLSPYAGVKAIPVSDDELKERAQRDAQRI